MCCEVDTGTSANETMTKNVNPKTKIDDSMSTVLTRSTINNREDEDKTGTADGQETEITLTSTNKNIDISKANKEMYHIVQCPDATQECIRNDIRLI